MQRSKENSYVLGLDLGVSSVGWALLDRPHQKFVAAGVRIFDSGMDENKFAKGEQGASNNVERRMARLHRRQLRRRAARQRDLFVALQEAALLPADEGGGRPEVRHRVLTDLDRRLTEAWRGRITQENPTVVAPEQVLPYFLRARALDHRLEPHELGRALYHLGQRRGYKSNRRDSRKAEDTEGTSKNKKKPAGEKDEKKVVLAAIAGLQEQIAASGARTLGEFLSRQDPSDARIRTRRTARKMFEQEFDEIWAAQEKHFPTILTPQFKERLKALLFFQRPISAGKPGFCELEKDCPRAPLFTLAAQRFRLLQKANDLAIVLATGEKQFLTPEQRKQVVDKLETEGNLTFPRIRTLLDLPKSTRFNLQLNEEARVRGNRTTAAMVQAFGENWHSLSESERKRRVRIWAETEHHEELARTATEEWGLGADAAQKLAETEPEDGYSKLSLRALSKLLPLMEAGKPFKTAETEIYGDRFSGNEAKDFLPPVVEVLPQIPNPAVMRALTELRKVVNAILREYGKPAQVRVELARDLKRSARDRQRLMDVMEDNRKRRAKIVKRIEQEAGIPNPSGLDIEKGLLFEELGECAYCGNKINFQKLFGDAPQFDVDHILPISRFPDNSYANKTLACNSCNAQKKNRTPFEAFGGDAECWDTLKARVASKHAGRFVLGGDKRKRFLLEESEEIADYSARHLADTRYITKLAARYLEELYGGRDREYAWEDQKRRRVFASSGSITATLRKAWGLNGILPKGDDEEKARRPEKVRVDHRHHAIDAMVIALSNQAAVQQLTAAAVAGDGRVEGRISSRSLQMPWAEFVPSLRSIVEGMIVSHRPDHKLGGPLHKETNYSPEHEHKGKRYVHVRTAVHGLSAKDIQSEWTIVDARVRAAVQAKLAEVGGNPKKLEKNFPMLKTRAGKEIPIRSVRIRVVKPVARIALPPRERYVESGDNHHVWLAARVDQRGREVEWTGDVVSRLDAMGRKRSGADVIEKTIKVEGSEALTFKFCLMRGDTVEMKDWSNGRRTLFVVNGFSAFGSGSVVISLSRHNDARIQTEMQKSGDFRRLSPETLRKLECRKVTVDLLGRVRAANG